MKIFTVTADFFAEMEKQIGEGQYKKYDFDGADIQQAAGKAWEQVWADQGAQVICRPFTEDYESTVPAEYTKDGKAHCYLYIAVR